ncbi:hypothetical protein BVC80_59g2 [Macleaya cordata]|uniref:Uncharacterized protein n=1 Tax=Macleaya cordata TaxID=56857 RepID=A0A200QJK0_MACCD|nr:hypothetical protein BVC80_59g2 [Macleaya cordata]
MGKQNTDPKVINSSILLLQERFRQLQRVKEMREEREVMKIFSKSETVSQIKHSTLFFHPELIPPSGPPLPSSLSFNPKSQDKLADFRVIETPILMNLRPENRVGINTTNTNENSEIDTSLHL